MHGQEFLRLREVAQMLRVTERTVRNYAARHGLPVVRLPGRAVVPRRELDEWLERWKKGGSREDHRD